MCISSHDCLCVRVGTRAGVRACVRTTGPPGTDVSGCSLRQTNNVLLVFRSVRLTLKSSGDVLRLLHRSVTRDAAQDVKLIRREVGGGREVERLSAG